MSVGVLRTPRGVPPLNPQAMKAIAANDEVAQILRGLKLDRQFFADKIRPDVLKDLCPLSPTSSSKELTRAEKKKENIRRASRRRMSVQGNSGSTTRFQQNVDFDIYINEAVMPVLAQALDALCRQLSRMREMGDSLDPKVRARFNPLTWLGQQLLRRHPKCARTPRRQLLYKSFKDWADFEKGRREVLRRKGDVADIFNQFTLRGGVMYETLPDVVQAIDQTLKLEGAVCTHPELEKALKGQGSTFRPEWSDRFSPGAAWTFEEFWYHFADVVVQHDVVPFSLLVRGGTRYAQEVREQEEYMERMRIANEEKRQEEEARRALMQEYSVVYDKLLANENIQSMINDSKILTGDDVRQGDVGYQYEVPPHGEHVSLLADFLVLLGIEGARRKDSSSPAGDISPTSRAGILRSDAKAPRLKGAKEEERYWDDGLASSWAILQKVHHAEMCDGVVDGVLLKQVLVPPVGFSMLRGKVEYELERKAERYVEEESDEEHAMDAKVGSKPSMEQLAMRLGMTMSRLDWLHKLFESFLEPTEPGGRAPCCLYPDMPASLNKEQMRSLIKEVEPELSYAQFEARFKRLDQDGSGLIEFDEFAHWVHSSDVRIRGSATMKMTFAELAHRYQEPIELIRYLHSTFKDQLPDGVIDDYPDNPAGLCRQEAVFLAGILTPGLDLAEFESNFAIVDQGSRQSGHCDFDEFLELLELDDLPAELRDRFESEN